MTVPGCDLVVLHTQQKREVLMRRVATKLTFPIKGNLCFHSNAKLSYAKLTRSAGLLKVTEKHRVCACAQTSFVTHFRVVVEICYLDGTIPGLEMEHSPRSPPPPPKNSL